MEAQCLYNFGASPPPGRFVRVFGGKRPYDFAYCHQDGVAIPYTLSEVLVYSPFFFQPQPRTCRSHSCMELGNRRASRCIDVTEGVQADQGRSGTQGGSGGGGDAAAACEGDGARSQVQGGSGAGLIHEWCGQKPHKTFTREKTQPGIVSTPRAC